MAGPILLHVSIVQHGVPAMMTCAAKNAKLDVSARPMFLILTGKCSGRTGLKPGSAQCVLSQRLRAMLEKHGRTDTFAN